MKTKLNSLYMTHKVEKITIFLVPQLLLATSKLGLIKTKSKAQKYLLLSKQEFSLNPNKFTYKKLSYLSKLM